MLRALAAALLTVAPAAALGQAPAAASKNFEAVTLDDVLAAVRNKTNMTFSADYTAPPIQRYDSSGKLVGATPATPTRGHGTQIEYFTADGKVFLWYPGNTEIVTGEWKTGTFPLIRKTDGVETRTELPTLCFKYSGQGGFSCNGAYLYLRRVTDQAAGDVFGLSRRPRPPFVLDRDRTTLDALRRKAG